MLVKICGITRREDAERAIRHGANALGFVFWPDSPRFIAPSKARAIVRELPPFVTAVGLFVNQPSAHINEVAAAVGLGAIQLQGDERPAQADELDRPVIKSVSFAGVTDEEIDRWPSRRLLLVDAHDPVRRGGTGRVADWTKAAALAARRPIVLAGGLTAENVEEAIARVRPYAIDVASGVEAAPGIKDHAKLDAFFDAVRRTER
jgi:phosphoribosylanthranilate isomerase